ncbi:hypothetical protein J7I84_14650 [Arthrobacter sp. ISL-85]|uniref:hypothetical protein n=1 Tax=Arthrobacter sp. ISL-85 TaxID=2819115 RepID=UPI001BE53A74|nr:hypothetical protein [Arthrobacter sp. ISL-85]MBT2567716.1 hypothetical protein [Arthrobacter sp. ISL-85]
MTAFFEDPRVTEALRQDVLEHLKATQPPEGSTPDEETGWWIAVAAGALTELAKARGEHG